MTVFVLLGYDDSDDTDSKTILFGVYASVEAAQAEAQADADAGDDDDASEDVALWVDGREQGQAAAKSEALDWLRNEESDVWTATMGSWVTYEIIEQTVLP